MACSDPSPGPSTLSGLARPNPYPNPGYLGSSSHTTIFDHISQDCTSTPGLLDTTDTGMSLLPYPPITDEHVLLQGANALRLLLDEYRLTVMRDLVQFWLAKGTNLALAESLVEVCSESVVQFFTSVSQDEHWHLDCARLLLHNSTQPLRFHSDTRFSEWVSQFSDARLRWETLGIFFLAVSRATIDVAAFPQLYVTREANCALRKLCTKLSDHALEIVLSLDCLNDLQLVLQYENFIMHSFVDGDHSYHAWRRIADVISSIFALGYHDDIDAKPDTPDFLTQLRKTAFARVYSADKNVAIFLGRPPRMTKRFSTFQIPASFADPRADCFAWDPDGKASYRAETRWSALCASLKEEVLELARDKNHEMNAQRIGAIQIQAETQWQALPTHFQLEGGLTDHDQVSSFERDFLISVRLNHLHVLFLLRPLMLNTLSEPDSSIITVAGEMLALVVEAIVVREQLTNSGTSLTWKIVHYGLPAAGMMLLAMLKQGNASMPAGLSRAKVLQDLSVFVVEIQKGTIVMRGDPIYVLLSKATRTIQKLLESFHSGSTEYEMKGGCANVNIGDDWGVTLGQDLWDFDTGFWDSLVDHASPAILDHSLTASQA
ncbi:hypothetical protein BO94DRAFT_209682 [Aspergillus sclerotioniger CBS 115572]|uniref:Transcription factor domain-containing protein n=1 Tax=Aspergillus sclerotioniger CBS 115572 TaxID=1450535 RepID=A0A317VLH9_9EURO|nr:hypothetical protein BO94DRAFT_209682 [Aspergillus sclerotioniger CBS 115572]PWY75196.1 hypothetical protein BO94DRAFT_209682 [Aspergillus sclerotioniger CBS 115572]